MSEYGKEVAKKMEDFMDKPNSIDAEIKEIQNADVGVKVRGALAAGVKKAFTKSEESEIKAGEAHEVMESIMTEGFDNAALEAKFEQKLDDKIANLQPEWTQFKNDTETQLAQTGDELFNVQVNNTRNKKAIFVVIDDDASPEIMTKWYPIIKAAGIPAVSAIVTSRIGGQFSISHAQLREMSKNGIEIVSHTHTHRRLSDLSLEEQEWELKTSRDWLIANGYSTSCVVYPFGGNNQDTRRIAQRYFKAGVHVDDGTAPINYPPLFNMRINRVGFGHSLEFIKGKIDEANANGGFMILTTHAGYEDFDPVKLEAIINYAKSTDIDIMNMKDALKNYGNVVDTQEFVLDADGKATGMSAPFRYLSDKWVTSANPITDYPRGKISIRHFDFAENQIARFGSNSAGTLFVVRTVDVPGINAAVTIPGDDNQSYQLFIDAATGDQWYRKWDTGTGSWRTFVNKSKPTFIYPRKIVVNELPAKSTKDFVIPNGYIKKNEKPKVNFEDPLPSGVLTELYAKDGSVTLRFANITDAQINLGSQSFDLQIPLTIALN